MNRKEFTEYILNNYAANEEKPWADSPEFSVFRHPSNKKWFVLIMKIPANRLGLKSENFVDVVNLKCEPVVADGVIDGKSIFRAYHMNKTHWISVLLGKADEEKLKMLLDISFFLTAPKKRGK